MLFLWSRAACRPHDGKGIALAPMRKLVRPLINWLRRFVLPHAVLSYSQEGEDLILARIFATHERGFYVDVGAHDPRRFSNTYKFYRGGWRGINIDAMPGSMAAFHRIRPRDINLEVGIAREPGKLRFYQFNDPALNTFDAALAASRNGGQYRITGEAEVRTETLASVLAEHLPPGQAIDFLSVDVEGLDLAVLQSNDWTRYRPACICVEHSLGDLSGLSKTDLYRLLAPLGYQLYAKTANTLIFIADHGRSP
jgi:FkbM family methyltransferase